MSTLTAQQEFALEAQAARVGRRGPTQNERVLAALVAASGEWVPMPDLVRASGAYAVHSRVSDLRRMGHRIDHRNQWRDGTCCSEYRLLPATP